MAHENHIGPFEGVFKRYRVITAFNPETHWLTVVPPAEYWEDKGIKFTEEPWAHDPTVMGLRWSFCHPDNLEQCGGSMFYVEYVANGQRYFGERVSSHYKDEVPALPVFPFSHPQVTTVSSISTGQELLNSAFLSESRILQGPHEFGPPSGPKYQNTIRTSLVERPGPNLPEHFYNYWWTDQVVHGKKRILVQLLHQRKGEPWGELFWRPWDNP